MNASDVIILAGTLAILVGTLVKLGAPIGHLPGDIVLDNKHVTIYIPITTSLLASILLSLLYYVFAYYR